MSSPADQTHFISNQSESHPQLKGSHSSDFASYPNIHQNDVASPQDNWTPVYIIQNPTQQPVDSPPSTQARAPIDGGAATDMPNDSNPYVSPAPAAPPKNTLDSVKDVLGRWGKKAVEATKKAEDLAGNMWQHLKTGPSFAEAAVGRIAQSTKVIAEGGYEKIFRQTFETVPEEQLLETYACYLSTSAGPVMGVLYLSTAKLAFCSDNPLSYKVGGQIQWSYYKVVIPLHQLRAVNPSTGKDNPSEKYIQIISVDNHEFWFMGFLHYDDAVQSIRRALQPRSYA